MDYEEIVAMNNVGIKRLRIVQKTSTSPDTKKSSSSKINFISKLNEMIAKHVEEYKPLEKAEMLFTELLLKLYPSETTLYRLVSSKKRVFLL